MTFRRILRATPGWILTIAVGFYEDVRAYRRERHLPPL